MIVSVMTASFVIFVLMLAWILVDRLYQKSLDAGPAQCEFPRHECGHCLMMDACSLHATDPDGAGPARQ